MNSKYKVTKFKQGRLENIEDLIAFKEQAFESVTKSKDLIILNNHSKNVDIIKND